MIKIRFEIKVGETELTTDFPKAVSDDVVMVVVGLSAAQSPGFEQVGDLDVTLEAGARGRNNDYSSSLIALDDVTHRADHLCRG